MKINNPTVVTDKRSKVKMLVLRDMAAASASVSYTGFTFKPRSLIVLFGVDGTTVNGISLVDNSGGTINQTSDYAGNVTTSTTGGAILTATMAAGDYYTMTWVSFDADGLSVYWSKTGSPTGLLRVSIMVME